LLLFDNDNSIDNEMFPQFKSMLASLWSDEGIKTAYKRRNEFQLSDSVQYFFDNLGRISVKDYVPTLKDILYCRKTTKGVIEFNIEIDRVPFLFVDVGGQRTQRQKWFQCFESVTAILFIASTSEYDQVLLEDRRTNRLEESRKIFDTIVNNKIFALISVILFLNKMDLLSTKVPNSDISRHFEDFSNVDLVREYAPTFKSDWRDVEDVKKFILFYFLSARRFRQKPLYHHFTTAVDTNNISIVFRDVKDTILKKNLDALLLQ